MNDDIRMAGVIGMILIVLALIISSSIAGCNKEANDKITELAKQGIRAEVDQSGRIRVVDMREFKPVPKEKE